MPSTMSAQTFYRDVRKAAVGLVSNLEALQSLRAIWDADVYGNTLPPGESDNEGLTRDDIGPALFATVDGVLGLDPSLLANLRRLK